MEAASRALFSQRAKRMLGRRRNNKTDRLPFAVIFPCLAIATFGQSNTPKDVQGWANTKWGMTQPQIMNAINDETRKEIRKGINDSLVIPDFAIGHNRFRVVLSVDEKTKLLRRVEPVDQVPGYEGPVVNSAPDFIFDDLKTLLISKFGPPTNVGATGKGNGTAVWRFKSTTITLSITTFSIGRLLTLNYVPTEKGNLDGL
jgi:hypothetical protein